jgi:hypothetical protein
MTHIITAEQRAKVRERIVLLSRMANINHGDEEALAILDQGKEAREGEAAAWAVGEKNQFGNWVWYDYTASIHLASEFAVNHRAKYGSKAEPFPLYLHPQPSQQIPADVAKDALKPPTHDDIRAAGGIVHSDGNIFFTNLEKLHAAMAQRGTP